MTTLNFPDSAYDLDVAFNNALAAGAMQGEDCEKTDFWGQFEYLASECDGDTALVDWFHNSLRGQFLKVPRKECEE